MYTKHVFFMFLLMQVFFLETRKIKPVCLSNTALLPSFIDSA